MKRFWLGFWAVFTGSVLGQSPKLDNKLRKKAGSGRGTGTEGSIVWDTPVLVEANSQTIVWDLFAGMTISWLCPTNSGRSLRDMAHRHPQRWQAHCG